MSDCTAKVTTADVTDEGVASTCFAPTEGPHFHRDDIADGETFQRQGDRLVRVDLHETPCVNHGAPGYHINDPVRWSDDTPGATPHDDGVTVSDEEVDAAIFALPLDVGNRITDDGMRAALLAAKRAEREQA